MILSQLSTTEARDVLIEIVPYISNIVSDEALISEINEKTDASKLSRLGLYVVGVQKITKLVPILLKSHEADVFGIVAAINGTTAESIANQNILATMSQIREILNDKDFIDFFAQSADSGEK